MSLIHPIQAVVSNRSGELIFAVLKNVIIAYRYDQTNGKYLEMGKWEDQFSRDEMIKIAVVKEQARQLAENEEKGIKKSKTNEGNTIEKKHDAKIPVPGPGAPPIYSQIRNLMISNDETMLLACADSDKSVLVFKIETLNNDNCLKLIKRQPFPKRPNAITITEDDKTVIIADKFGDVYSMLIESPVIENIDEEFEPILGHVSMLTGVLSTTNNGMKFVMTSDRDEHIKISHFPQSYIVDKWLFGHKEFVSSICIPSWNSNILVSAGGDHGIFLWDWIKGEKLDEFDFTDLVLPYINENHLAPDRFQNEENDLKEFAVSKLVSLPNNPYFAFFVEATKLLIILEVDQSTYKMKLLQKIVLPYYITFISTFSDDKTMGFNISLDNRESGDKDFVKFIALDTTSNTFSIKEEQSDEFNTSIVNSFSKEDSIVKVELDEVYPLYNIISLKKHGEHYS
ncbi:hypothetical protein Kpol_1036p90 [Vanderwaltozyma polyspora DSM 70294]|uniref:tRNA (guanine-N(7)-)-methyltransferase non-catalytic subunit TRM82 n=1 Tax=Vanderwaltozyma polyspora (strain ATCC 22028 / DSM 70294 / BCRC 21397 / CBS 2163 / NBRC 10782 / NRRL Y-8283 / UCD 57-17) TaxID=436907 RepID=TRM82_VANPO|nr:uncharacterized protein Kpol_1036p90 [Vanderwaltozyma polyspora DSM 70294]A7TEN6.1 RecName: Full=tRNA (guanine-N(7)-)-methyltransferase non-catalytic subunit TRM82; AltName: Full=Transfer RNA methyltransferase 82 [Vanderwaltozyma polyspora DSM 70294]EDO19343.1 hypothetical protein Kpol_1036p90 [Vanderwaltozyma polyspora DSM 70294]